jgi:hypothetical protein
VYGRRFGDFGEFYRLSLNPLGQVASLKAGGSPNYPGNGGGAPLKQEYGKRNNIPLSGWLRPDQLVDLLPGKYGRVIHKTLPTSGSKND